MDNNESTFRKFQLIEKIVKPYDENAAIDLADVCAKIIIYQNSLQIDKRKLAIGSDLAILYYDMFGSQLSDWQQNYGSSTYGGFGVEQSFFLKRPNKTLFSYPSWNPSRAKYFNSESNLTLVNGFQVDLFEKFAKDQSEGWSYDVISRQAIENGDGGFYDFIAINIWDIIDDPISVLDYYNMLEAHGVLCINASNYDGILLEDNGIYSAPYEIHQILKEAPSSLVYHDFTQLGVTFVIKM